MTSTISFHLEFYFTPLILSSTADDAKRNGEKRNGDYLQEDYN